MMNDAGLKGGRVEQKSVQAVTKLSLIKVSALSAKNENAMN